MGSRTCLHSVAEPPVGTLLVVSASLLDISLDRFLAAADLPGCPIAVAGRAYRMASAALVAAYRTGHHISR